MSVLGIFVARFPEAIFVTGSIGPASVFALSGIEDLKTLFGREESNHS